MRDAADPWAWHDIGRVTPSLVGYLQDDVAYALLQVVPAIRMKARPSAAVIRGRAVDRALEFVAHRPDAPDDVVLGHADQVFRDEETRELVEGGAFDPAELAEERASLPGFLTTALPAIRQWGPPERSQARVEVTLEGLGVPMIGRADFLYPSRVRELKSTARMPSAPDPRHCKQVATYAVATGREPWVDYLTPRELRSYRVPDVDQWLAEIAVVLFAFRRLLATSRDIFEVCALVAPNYANWCWNDPDARDAARRIWGA